MTCFQHLRCSINDWTTKKELNPLKVDRLSYRNPTDTILDFIAQGLLIDKVQERNYSEDLEDNNLSDNYFEDTSKTVDNLLDVKKAFEDLNDERGNTDLSMGETEPATKKAKATAQPVEKSDNSEVEK